jgi:hypothetical protein
LVKIGRAAMDESSRRPAAIQGASRTAGSAETASGAVLAV